MTPRRLEQLSAGLNSLEHNVLGATPIAEAWTVALICSELRRVGRRHDNAHVVAVLNRMKEKGVVREPRPGLFVRVEARATADEDKPAAPLPDHQEPPMNAIARVPAAPLPADPMSAIAELSQRLRANAAEQVALARQLDDLALGVEERLQRESADSQRLRQLRALLTEASDAAAR